MYFGKVDSLRWGYQDPGFFIVRHEVLCQNCGKIECDSKICLKLIKAYDVLAAVEKISGNNSSSGEAKSRVT